MSHRTIRRAASIVAFVLAALAGPGLLGASAASSVPTVPLVEGSTSTARVSVPYPGHSTEFDLTARALSGASSELVLLVDGGTGPLASGPDALRLVLADGTGQVLAEGTAQELSRTPIALGALGTEPRVLRGTATLPASAGDDLQGVGMTLRLSLVAGQDAGPTPPDPDSGDLAVTGAGALLLLLLAAALVGAGLAARAARRRAGAAVLTAQTPSGDTP